VPDAERQAPRGALRPADSGRGRRRGLPRARAGNGRRGATRGCGRVPGSVGRVPASWDAEPPSGCRRRASQAEALRPPNPAMRVQSQAQEFGAADAKPLGAWPGISSPEGRHVKVTAAMAWVSEPSPRRPGSLRATFHSLWPTHNLGAWRRSLSRARSSVRPAASRSQSRCPRTPVFISTSAGLATICSDRSRATAASSAHMVLRPVRRGNWKLAPPRCEAEAEPTAGPE
jgi:hypothetical protein